MTNRYGIETLETGTGTGRGSRRSSSFTFSSTLLEYAVHGNRIRDCVARSPLDDDVYALGVPGSACIWTLDLAESSRSLGRYRSCLSVEW